MWTAAKCFIVSGGLQLGCALIYFLATYGYLAVRSGNGLGSGESPVGPALALIAMALSGLAAMVAGLIRSFPGIWSPPQSSTWGSYFPDELALRFSYIGCLVCAILASWLGLDYSWHRGVLPLFADFAGNLLVPLALCAMFAYLLVKDVTGKIEYPREPQ